MKFSFHANWLKQGDTWYILPTISFYYGDKTDWMLHFEFLKFCIGFMSEMP